MTQGPLAPAGFAPDVPGFAADPWPAYAALRDVGLCWHEGFGMWLAGRFADVQAIATDRRMVRSPDSFTTAEERARLRRAANFHDMPYHERFVQTSMLEVDGPDHTRMRRAVFPFFTRTRLESLRDWIAAFTDGEVRRAVARARFDFIADLAAGIPGQVIGRLMDLPPADAPQMTQWSEETVSFFDPDRTEARKARAEAATRAFHDYLQDRIAERRRALGDDLLSVLIRAEAEGVLTPDEVVINAMQLLHAGHGSTIDAMGNGMAALLAHPGQMARLRADPALMPLAVQEIFRYAAPLPFFHRFASEPIEVAGRLWPTGTKFGLLYPAANRDPEAFPDPDRFDAGRQPNRHLAFGSGPHVCLGNNLSRMTMEALFTALLAQTAVIEADGPAAWKPGLQAHGPLTLPVRVIK